MNRFISIVLICSLCIHVTPINAYHVFLRQLLQPFMMCADENGIPRDKSETGNLNNDIDTLRIGYSKIMECIDAKLPSFRRFSDEVAEWYIGYMFDINTTRRLQNNFTESNAYDFSCLDKDKEYYERDVCFNGSFVGLAKLMEISRQYNLSDQDTLLTICNGGPFMRPGFCSTAGDPCTPGVGNFLMNVLFPALVGRDCRNFTSTWSTSKPYTTYSEASSSNNFEASAFFACGDLVYNSSLDRLFPPSESSISLVTNLTAAKLQQQESMKEFCSKRREYSQCVTQRIQGAHNFIDLLIGNVISVVTLQDAFDIYCENQDLISSQYECVFNATSAGQCFGGVDDLLKAGARNIGKVPSIQLCRDMKSAVSCRLKTQINQCDPQFVSVMQQFYDNVLGQECYPDGLRPNAMTDVLKCYVNYTVGLQDRIGNETNPVAIVAREIEYICKNDIEGITDCMFDVFSNSKKPYDVFSARLLSAKNIKPLARRSCALVPNLKASLQCVINGFEVLVQQPNNCLSTYSETVTKTMNGTEMSNTSDTNKAADMCRLFGSLKPCLKPVFTSCDASLGNSVGSLLDEIIAACNNTNYLIKEKEGGVSSVARLSSAIGIIIVSFTITVL